LCLQQLISDPMSFQSTARELLEWCSDCRAFTTDFEVALIDCLQVKQPQRELTHANAVKRFVVLVSSLNVAHKQDAMYNREHAELRTPLRNRNFSDSTYKHIMTRSMSRSLTQ